ncbi:MAG TPA: DUF4249 domain-containing protein, partial [Puia sp.]|nr:DUF4249 domain-containing protein [Puia sp.]
SGQFKNIYEDSAIHYINDAQVSIKDDAGDSVSCALVSDGNYETTDSTFKGIAGRSYILTVRLSNGKTYISKPAKMEAAVPINSISIIYDNTIGDFRPTQLIISANTQDPPGIHNYYRWTAYGYIPRKSVGDDCEPPAHPPCEQPGSRSCNCCPYLCTCHAFCEQLLRNDQVNILSDKYMDGQNIQQPVFYSPVYWHGKHFIEIKQQSLTQSDYQYWQRYLEQTNRTGSILDPLPSSVTGNIYNQSDSSDLALGLFSAMGIITKKVTILPFFLQDYLLIGVASTYILPGDCDCVFPNTLPDDADAPGWETAQLIEMK